MASTTVVAVEARCPLCGTPIDTPGAARVSAGRGAHLISLYKHGGGAEGFLLCEECSLLTAFPAGITLN
jgi:hypothetical protein